MAIFYFFGLRWVTPNIMTIEQRLNQMERQIKRQRIGLFVLTAALCGVVSMAATESKNGYFDAGYAKKIFVVNYKGEMAVGLANTDNDSAIGKFSLEGEPLVALDATSYTEGWITLYGDTPDGPLMRLGATGDGNGSVETYAQKTGDSLIRMTSTDDGGASRVFNKTGDIIVSLHADDYGNGEVGSLNRKGKGRKLSSQ